MTDLAQTKYILVVDDDPTMQLVLQGMIEKAGFRPVIAENGEKALQFLEIGGANISLVLLDRHMPDMDGFGVVEKLQALHENSGIPVIMQSGSKTPKDIREAIDAGIFYYLTKPFKLEALQTVLNFAIEKSALRSALQEQLQLGYTPENLLLSASFEFSTFGESQKLAILLSTFFPEPQRVFPGMLALLSNAIEHGSYGFGFEKKANLITEGTYAETLEKANLKKQNARKIVETQFVHKDGRFSVRITDQGHGFNWKDWIAFEKERDASLCGYGILKAQRSFDELKYNTAGNQVMASVFKTK